MNTAEDWLRQASITKVQLMVRPENTCVQAFYESIGYGELEPVVFAKPRGNAIIHRVSA